MIFALAFAAALSSRTVVTVDQTGKVNDTNAVAQAAQMAANQVKADIALAKAEAAADAAASATGTLHEVVRQIGENELVIYRQGFTDSLGVAVVLPEDTKCRIAYYKPNTGVRPSDGYVQHTIRYALTENADGIEAGVKVASPLVALEDFARLDPSLMDPVMRLPGETYEFGGERYPYVYEITFYLPPGQQSFAVVYLDPDDAEVDGATFVIENGIAGGASDTVEIGGKRFTFTGGLLTGVEDVD
jgi:hypothetical protein